MIYLYDTAGKITAEYEDWKLRDVELDSERIIQDEMRAMAEERAVSAGKIK